MYILIFTMNIFLEPVGGILLEFSGYIIMTSRKHTEILRSLTLFSRSLKDFQCSWKHLRWLRMDRNELVRAYLFVSKISNYYNFCFNHLTEMTNAVTNCASILGATTCLLDAATALGTAASSLLSNTPDFDTYFTAYCRYVNYQWAIITWCHNNVKMTLIWSNYVTLMSIRRRYDVMCQLG